MQYLLEKIVLFSLIIWKFDDNFSVIISSLLQNALHPLRILPKSIFFSITFLIGYYIGYNNILRFTNLEICCIVENFSFQT